MFAIAAAAKSSHNPCAMIGRTTSRITAALAGAAFVLALAVAAAPQLHERLHNISDTVTHQCAVTLVSSGNCEHAFASSPQCQPDFVPAAPALTAADAQILPHAVDFALLEHAPPSFS